MNMNMNTSLLGDKVGDTQTNCVTWSNDELQDVFGSHSPFNGESEGFDNRECLDLQRLKSKHETEGYREGICQGKEKSVQMAFDEGFGLGAALGSHVGLLLGLLEGLSRTRGLDVGEVERLQELFGVAEKELSVRNIFGTEWWEEQGLWKYDITDIEDESEATFHHVAKAHPLLKKWATLMEEEIRKWHLNLRIYEKAMPATTIKGVATSGDLPQGRYDLYW